MITYSKPLKRKLKNGTSRVYSVRAYDSFTGKRTWISTGCKNYQAAREWVRTAEMNQALGKDRVRVKEVAEKTFRDAYAEWIDEKKEKVSQRHFKNLKYVGDRFWLPSFGKFRLPEISSDRIKDFLVKRRRGLILMAPQKKTDEKKTRPLRPVSTTTANNDLRYLRGFFGYCRRRGWVTDSPFEGIESYASTPRRRTRSIRVAEEDKLLAACRGGKVVQVSARRNVGGPKGGKVSDPIDFEQTIPAPDYVYPLVLTALRCGFRRRTLLSLRWRDLDFKRAEWSIPAEFMKTSEDYVAPVPRSVLVELRAYRKRLSKEYLQRGVDTAERVGPDATIFGLAPTSSIRRSFESAVKRAGLKLTFHDLRRVFLNRCRDNGLALDETMALTGHKSLRTVMAHYREVPHEQLRNAVRAIDRGELGLRKSGDGS